MKPFSLNTLQKKIERVLEYRRRIDSDYILQIYSGIRKASFHLVENRSIMSSEQLDHAVLNLDHETDKIFMLLKNYERIIFSQREYLAKIASLSEKLKDSPSTVESIHELLDEIKDQSGNWI